MMSKSKRIGVEVTVDCLCDGWNAGGRLLERGSPVRATGGILEEKRETSTTRSVDCQHSSQMSQERVRTSRRKRKRKARQTAENKRR